MFSQLQKSFVAGLGASFTTWLLLSLTHYTGHLWLMAPFGASCVILFALPDSPLARAQNVIMGHFLTALTGLIVLHFAPVSSFTIAFAVGIGIILMMISKTTHPPAGANPLLILLSGKTFTWGFLLFPVLTGATMLVLTSAVYHWLSHQSNIHAIGQKVRKIIR